MEYILAVDLGTTAIKVLLFQSDGQVISNSTQEYKLLTPTELAVELEVEKYWDAFADRRIYIRLKQKVTNRKFLWMYGGFRTGDKYEVSNELDRKINILPIIIRSCCLLHC